MTYDRFVMTINGEEHWAIDDLSRVQHDVMEAIRLGGRTVTVNTRQDSPQVEPAQFYIDGATKFDIRQIE
ncbi:hypothetical protein A0130_07980 [Leifsonia xyli]|uniref:hypothetical protein n=1 Tax=Leifsonia xyli TaxID=1575 RepID=UPI0007CDEA4E|nr:hypothetical protein A0130_07980 [Leifsonia xyli]